MHDSSFSFVKEIKKLALLGSHEPEYYGEVDEAMVVQAEQELGVKFPPSYRAYLRYLGAARLLGYDFDGLPDNSMFTGDNPDTPCFLNVVEHTSLFREEVSYFTDTMVYLTDNGGPVFFCLDTSVLADDDEAAVFAYFFGKRIFVAPSFIDFIRLRANNEEKLYAIVNEGYKESGKGSGTNSH